MRNRVFTHICFGCKSSFENGDYKWRYCKQCKENATCEVCKKQLSDPQCKLCMKHKSVPLQGKTYLQIYGTTDVKCGFQKGEVNIAKLPEIRKKISVKVINSYTPELRKLRSKHGIDRFKTQGYIFGKLKYVNIKGEHFRSSLEKDFSHLLIKNKIKYKYEVPVHLINGHWKIVDFKVGNTLIEISGFAYKAWQDAFLTKIDLLRKSCDNQILILTYPEKINEIYKVCQRDIYTAEVGDEKRILKMLKFCQYTNKIKKNFTKYLKETANAN